MSEPQNSTDAYNEYYAALEKDEDFQELQAKRDEEDIANELERVYQQTGKKYSRSGKVPPKGLLLKTLFKDLVDSLSMTDGMNGVITIQYRLGLPTKMSNEFTVRNKDDNAKYADLKERIGGRGYISHMGLGEGKAKMTHGRKDYGYIEEVWGTYHPQDKGLSRHDISKHMGDILKQAEKGSWLQKILKKFKKSV